MKTVRFAQVVARSGRPHVHALWADPKRDPAFNHALEANRVMTIMTGAHGKADWGEVGLKPGQGRQFLVFPKSLAPFVGARVIGVRFEVVEQPPNLAPDRRKHWSRTTTRRASVVSRHRNGSNERHQPPPPTRRGPLAHPSNSRDAGRTIVHRTGDSSLVREVQAALGEMRRGESAAAYARLQRAVTTEPVR